MILLVLGTGADAFVSHGAVTHPALLPVFMVLALLVYLSDQHVLPAWQLDAALAVALAALLVCGPLGAVIVAAFPEPFRPLVERHKRAPRPLALVADTASFAWQALAAYAVLRCLPHGHGALQAWPADVAAGATMVAVNVGMVWGLLHHLVDGEPWRGALGIIRAMLPLALVAATIAVLYALVGVPALAAFAAIACLPGVIVRLATPILAPRAAALDRVTATRRYAEAIAATLGLSGARRRAISLAAGSDAPAQRAISAGRLFDDRYNAGQLRFEWDQIDRHGAESWMTLDACVLEVAGAWASLTAQGTAELSHPAALRLLEGERWHLSGRVLRAAWHVVDEQPIPARTAALAPTTRPLARRITALGADLG